MRKARLIKRTIPNPLQALYAPTIALVEQDGGLYAWIIESAPHSPTQKVDTTG